MTKLTAADEKRIAALVKKACQLTGGIVRPARALDTRGMLCTAAGRDAAGPR